MPTNHQGCVEDVERCADVLEEGRRTLPQG